MHLDGHCDSTVVIHKGTEFVVALRDDPLAHGRFDQVGDGQQFHREERVDRVQYGRAVPRLEAVDRQPGVGEQRAQLVRLADREVRAEQVPDVRSGVPAHHLSASAR